MNPPNNDEIEVSVFGPSYGESVAVHLGDERWLLVDSCIKPGGSEPVAIEHLRRLGLDPSNCVSLIVVTHWHDDHISGISKTLAACSNAAVCVPAAFKDDMFKSFLAAHTDLVPSKLGTGVDEITTVFEQMRRRDKNHLGIEDKRILNISADKVSFAQPIEVWALSPSSFQVTESLGKLGAFIPEYGQTKRRAVATDTNDHSIALWVKVGEDAVLLGADLEETSDKRAGWSAVVASTNRPQGRATLFKVPHHGSQNGHNAEVWSTMLATNPLAVLTPWNRSRKLPRPEDIDRLKAQTTKLHLTAPPCDLSKVKHDYEVQKLLRDFGIITYRENPEIGVVTARRKLGDTDWSVTRSLMA